MGAPQPAIALLLPLSATGIQYLRSHSAEIWVKVSAVTDLISIWPDDYHNGSVYGRLSRREHHVTQLLQLTPAVTRGHVPLS